MNGWVMLPSWLIYQLITEISKIVLALLFIQIIQSGHNSAHATTCAELWPDLIVYFSCMSNTSLYKI